MDESISSFITSNLSLSYRNNTATIFIVHSSKCEIYPSWPYYRKYCHRASSMVQAVLIQTAADVTGLKYKLCVGHFYGQVPVFAYRCRFESVMLSSNVTLFTDWRQIINSKFKNYETSNGLKVNVYYLFPKINKGKYHITIMLNYLTR